MKITNNKSFKKSNGTWSFLCVVSVKSLMDVRLQYIETLFNPENITIQQDHQVQQVWEDIMFFMS